MRPLAIKISRVDIDISIRSEDRLHLLKFIRVSGNEDWIHEENSRMGVGLLDQMEIHSWGSSYSTNQAYTFG